MRTPNAPSQTVMFTDSANSVRVNPEGSATAAYNTPDGASWPQYRHLETTTVGFMDGHVKSLRKTVLEVKSATDGDQTALTGDNQFTLWNLY